MIPRLSVGSLGLPVAMIRRARFAFFKRLPFFSLGLKSPWVAIPAAILGIGLLFSLYNRFLLDRHLQVLKISLSILEGANVSAQAEAALLLLDQAISTEMAREELDLRALAALQYVQGTLTAGEAGRPVEDAKVLVSAVAEDRTLDRPIFLRTLDGMVTAALGAFRRETFLPRRRVAPVVPEGKEAFALKEAQRLERLGSIEGATRGYERALSLLGDWAGRSGVLLRLGALYQRQQSFDQAERLFRQALQATPDPQEVTAARRALEGLNQARALGQKTKGLEARLKALPPGPDRQRLAFELGSLRILLYDFVAAAEAFRQARLSDPGGKLVLPALFKEAWCLRNSGNLEEAMAGFQEIIRQDPIGPLAAAAKHQMALGYKATGDFETAALLLGEAVKATPDRALQATLRLQTGWTYLYDLNDPTSAQEHLRLWQSEASLPLAPGAGRITPRAPAPSASKALESGPPPGTTLVRSVLPPPPTPAFAADTPVVALLGKFLPLFVHVFEERLAKYMRGAGIKTIERRYTEPEFQELVVSRVKELFPGQVTEVETRIRREGYVGSGKITLGPVTIPLSARVGVKLGEERPLAVVHEIKIGGLNAPEPLLKLLEKNVNESIVQQPSPLKIRRYELYEGYAIIDAELVEEEE